MANGSSLIILKLLQNNSKSIYYNSNIVLVYLKNNKVIKTQIPNRKQQHGPLLPPYKDIQATLLLMSRHTKQQTSNLRTSFPRTFQDRESIAGHGYTNSY